MNSHFILHFLLQQNENENTCPMTKFHIHIYILYTIYDFLCHFRNPHSSKRKKRSLTCNPQFRPPHKTIPYFSSSIIGENKRSINRTPRKNEVPFNYILRPKNRNGKNPLQKVKISENMVLIIVCQIRKVSESQQQRKPSHRFPMLERHLQEFHRQSLTSFMKFRVYLVYNE